MTRTRRCVAVAIAGDSDTATHYYLGILERDPHTEDAHLRLVRALATRAAMATPAAATATLRRDARDRRATRATAHQRRAAEPV
jgi:hypothetical protein